jgi:hypothetical protein
MPAIPAAAMPAIPAAAISAITPSAITATAMPAITATAMPGAKGVSGRQTCQYQRHCRKGNTNELFHIDPHWYKEISSLYYSTLSCY